MRGPSIACALLLGATLTGCISADSTTTDDQIDAAAIDAALVHDLGLMPDGTPVPMAVGYDDCDEQTGIFPVPMEAMAGMVPEGFELEAFDPAGRFAVIVAPSFVCMVDGEEVAEMWGLVSVIPPAGYASDEFDFHLIPIGAFTSSERSAAIWSAWGFDPEHVSVGDVHLERMAETPLGRVGHAMGSDDSFTVHLYTTVQGPAGEESPGGARVFAVRDGAVTGAFDLAWGPGTLLGTGEAVLAFQGSMEGLAPPAQPGAAFHVWGEDYDWVFSHVALGPMETMHEH